LKASIKKNSFLIRIFQMLYSALRFCASVWKGPVGAIRLTPAK
jgi:hypothetical protein